MVLRHNTFLNSFNQTDAISLFEDFGAINNVTVDNNLMAGGSFSLYAGGGTNMPSTNIVVTNNRFSTRYMSTGGTYGPAAYWDTAPSNIWSGNVWYDGAKAGQGIPALSPDPPMSWVG